MMSLPMELLEMREERPAEKKQRGEPDAETQQQQHLEHLKTWRPWMPPDGTNFQRTLEEGNSERTKAYLLATRTASQVPKELTKLDPDTWQELPDRVNCPYTDQVVARIL